MRYVTGLIVNLVLLFGQRNCDSENFRQEAAKVVYANPKYVKDVKGYTFRRTRNSPYLTSLNGTILQPWGNNVTFMIDCISTKLRHEIFSMDFKVCDAIKVTWTRAWLKEYTNVSLQCPVSPNTYTFKDIELPPKNFPVPMPAGDYNAGITFYLTKTREKLADIRINLKFQKNKMAGK